MAESGKRGLQASAAGFAHEHRGAGMLMKNLFVLSLEAGEGLTENIRRWLEECKNYELI
jgi:hypothetical protein